MKRAVIFALGLAGAVSSLASLAAAEVTQPDGQVMPKTSNNGEVSLQQLFDFREGPGVIDAKAAAATEPATFKPLCDFSAQLLLHETGGKAGVGWYNSPKDATPPTTVCDEATGMNDAGKPCSASDIFLLIPGDVAKPPFSGTGGDPLHDPGQVFNGADLANNKYYTGGEIGFVVLTGQKHYSERRLNPACVGDACIVPGNWIPTIVYASQKTPRGYYLCSEDQEIYADRWGDNDGDFQDFVFLFTGLVCSGSGEQCDTGKPGICAAGLTDCANANGESACRPARSPGEEACNGLDDDCDGELDEGDLCPQGELCVKGRCIPECGTGEFRCDKEHQCVAGACVEKSCVNVDCDAGEVCMGGQCIGACDDVSCPTGQTCLDGVCSDPCAGIDCGQGFVCEGGACRVECSCAGCQKGECDANSGQCVDTGCAGVACPGGEHCAAGKCIDDCAEARCPGGAACENGECLPPPAGNDGAGGEATIPDLNFGGEDSTPSTGGSSASGGNSASGGSGGSTDSGSGNAPDEKSGCGCRAVGRGAGSPGAALLALAGALMLATRRRRGVRYSQ